MMIRLDTLLAIKNGEVDLAFRRWERPRVVVGTALRTAIGVVEVTSVEPVTLSELRSLDARRSGHSSLAELRDALRSQPDRQVYRIGLRHTGPDPREILRDTVPDGSEIEEIWQALMRLDRASLSGPWTQATLQLIDAYPEVRAPELAAQVGRPTADFKRDVRKLKEKGLTESLAIGYRLSPRGEAVLDHRIDREPRAPRKGGTALPRTIGPSATRALRAEEATSLEAVAAWRRRDLAALHGVGPIALRRLEEALAERGLAFRPDTSD